ncbi:Anaphase-promoting complex (APC), subunit 1 (meiotic check point regulator/Tsg24) [Plasmopara halstedii]|uniref:Anaphase-promoting complex (APC), subunit 1 (Meiotic check point regulator/Tsg24) n=1 Tax=Plasmopara halstedii TaxID=4781 RepID=A0A0P1AYB1_PLAHL|nr:Anaphase-promoting complex (APC), subunit 1 (meiotic check point regulator/Tsg24) [Plasmopara halstedii]CEG47463.1 Anaphase-promoting complex (APC), subunit 1 (meiotic check point regulator/Tsg24) [Plasmopara halstedii]|eukprot:XP_024583832.1 Anaphase-promoting complex (APC), subunit 1 (meiotic check point regulator/Tsg24) [Plasmopara halstedii]
MTTPKIHVQCAGVRSNQFSPPPDDNECSFVDDSSYASFPFLVRVEVNSVSFINRGTHVEERRFVFSERVVHAVLADFSQQHLYRMTSHSNVSWDGSTAPKETFQLQLHPHLCVLVRSDCLNIYTAAGEVFEVALPFQANRLFPIKGQGLLMQRSPAVQIPVSRQTPDIAAMALARKGRRASTSNRGDNNKYDYSFEGYKKPTRPRYFTLRHPLDEIKPIALSAATINGEKLFISDSQLEGVDVLMDGVGPIFVAFHQYEQNFCVFRLNVLQKSAKERNPEIRVVDGPMWTRFWTKNDLKESRVWIDPDWIATTLWKTSQVGSIKPNSAYLSPIASSFLRLSTPPDTQKSSLLEYNFKRAFFASSVDNSPLLCLLDKDTGTLLLKSVVELDNENNETVALDKGNNCSNSVRILHCLDAVPIRQPGSVKSFKSTNIADFEFSTDIVVLERDYSLTLYRAHFPICYLVVLDVELSNILMGAVGKGDLTKNGLSGSVHLNAVGRGSNYEIIYPNLRGYGSEKKVRFEHPLQVLCCPLLEQIYLVLASIIPPRDFCVLKAHVVSLAQYKAQSCRQLHEFTGLEWQAFSECILNLQLKQSIEESKVGPEEMSSNDAEMTATSSFNALQLSEFHDIYQYEHAMLFATMDLPVIKSTVRCHRITRSKEVKTNTGLSSLGISSEVIFAGLHMLCEDLKMSTTLLQDRLHLAKFLLAMAKQLKLDRFIEYYQADNCVLQRCVEQNKECVETKRPRKTLKNSLLCFSAYGSVPDLLLWLQDKISATSKNLVNFYTLFDDVIKFSGCLHRLYDRPLRRTDSICRIFGFMCPNSVEKYSCVQTAQSNTSELIMFLTQDPVGKMLSIDDLPVGLSFPIIQTINQLKHHPPSFITEDICQMLGREDLSASAERLPDYFPISEREYPRIAIRKSEDFRIQSDKENHNECDGLEDLICRSQPLFPSDQRMKEVARLLRSSRPLCLKLEKKPDLSDLDYAQEQQARLLLLCKRSMALSVARGMVTLGSLDTSSAQTQTWRLRIPALPLQGRKPPTNAIVELDLSGYAKELTYWPQFHNGCATGLRLPTHDLSGVINRHWIKYHRPSVGDMTQRSLIGAAGSEQATSMQSTGGFGRNLEEAYAAHAGLLLGIGLRGHLKCLSMADVYNYLSLSNEFVTVAIMLGMASTAADCRRKQKQQTSMSTTDSTDEQSQIPQAAHTLDEMASLEANHFLTGFSDLASSDATPLLGIGLELALERSVSKMLCLHVPSLLPPPFRGFSVPASTQTAALLGLGILYQGTGYRLMTELLLAEIVRSPSSSQFVESTGTTGSSTPSFDQIDGYALAAGMALGLVTLGRGHSTTGDPGLADLKLEEKLHKYIVGGAQQSRESNAIRSCLYRGRQAQGDGSLGIGQDLSGSTTGHMASESNDTSRERRHPSNRSGARGSSELVNISVTACASALTLAFMYMQTSNKAVAAQLAVPDTLILLDHIRPDILLVRTLAKNLIMWNEISPTKEWIEQNEIPAQLLQEYTSIQKRKGGTQVKNSTGPASHADLSSICEAYANIAAGACMSMGLRFAGTANVSARATLRSYVVHFRGLRNNASSPTMLLSGKSNVVAAATGRATVERCLAVCAQALALVDAGMGHVETLTLLRSITLRQRVDSAMTYGNHMALSMAIGLLFLGGGRATISQSKEAIAALVISLYPMPPINTADNKYHLQAFRHLYVLAVDNTRYLNTVDVDTQETCTVQIDVTLAPKAKVQRVFQTPCLLPDIATVKRLAISDPEYYPVEILSSPISDQLKSSGPVNIRTANSIRLEVLRNNNVILLKRRHRKTLNIAYPTGSTDNNQLRRLFCTYFLSSDSNAVDDIKDNKKIDDLSVTADWGNSWWSTQLSSWILKDAYEELQTVKLLFLNALHSLFRLQQVPQLSTAIDVISLLMFSKYCRLHLSLSGIVLDSKEFKSTQSTTPQDFTKNSFILFEFGEWLTNQTEEALRALWYRTSLHVMASARVQLVPLTSYSVSEAFCFNVLVQYFAGPSLSMVSIAVHQSLSYKGWRARIQRALARSHIQHQSRQTAQFQLSPFLENQKLTDIEKTFWLKLVSFFLETEGLSQDKRGKKQYE